jgi:hypothetical protein
MRWNCASLPNKSSLVVENCFVFNNTLDAFVCATSRVNWPTRARNKQCRRDLQTAAEAEAEAEAEPKKPGAREPRLR